MEAGKGKKTEAVKQGVREEKLEGKPKGKGKAAKVEAPKVEDGDHKPVAVLCIGMAGSGKTTFMQRINAHLSQHKEPTYVINLDPAVANLPYQANIDIRETVNYKEVMKHYKLGPNGGIVTALNLFATKFDQVLEFLEKRAKQLEYVIVDTPGQIEVFTWSASGTIITDTIAAAYPTVVAYIIDTPRTAEPSTFMSNMLYACSILYKTKLPFILVFNKVDVVSHEFALEWMQDFEAFQQSIEETSYMGTLIRSMGLVLDEFYQNLKCVGVSSLTGEGIDDFFKAVQEGAQEYYKDYIPELERVLEEKKKKEEERKAKQLAKLNKDLGGKTIVAPGKNTVQLDDVSDDEEEEEFEDEDYYGNDGSEEETEELFFRREDDEEEEEHLGPF